MKNFIKGFRFTPSNYPAAVEAQNTEIQKTRIQTSAAQSAPYPRTTGRNP